MKRFFLFSALMMPGITAAAQTFAPAPKDSLFYELQGIEVIATRVGKDVPVAHTDLSSEQIARSNYAYDIPSILALTPSVVSTTETGIGIGGTSLRLRGTDPTRLNVTVNGVGMNEPDSHSMYWYDTPDLASSVGTMQIQRGAGTSTNGAGAFGGAVSMTTAALSTKAGGDATFSYGSYNTNKQAVHYSTGMLRDRYIFDLRLSHIGSDGYIDRASTDMKSYMLQGAYYNGGSVLKFVSFGGKTKTYLTYNGTTLSDIAKYGRRYHTSGQYKTSDGPFTLSDGSHVDYYDDQTDNYLQINNQLIFNHTFNNRWSANVTGFYTYGNGFYKQYKDDAWTVGYDNLQAGVDQADLIREKKMRNNRYGVNATGNYSTDALDLVFGTSLCRYEGPHFGTIDWMDGVEESVYNNFQWYRNQVEKGDYNVFAKATWTIAKGLNIFADLQLRHVDLKVDGVNDNYDWNTGHMQPIAVDESYNFFNPHFGVKYQIASAQDIYASFAASSKEPTRSDFTDRYNFSSLTDNPKPEHLYDFEAGYDYTGRIVSFNANLYYMLYKDQLVPTGIVNDSDDNLNINVPDSYRAGVELTLAVRAAKWLTLGGSATLSDNRIKDYTETIGDKTFNLGDTKIAYSPSAIASAYADFKFGDFSALLNGQFVGKQYLGNGNFDDLSLPSYFVANLNLAYQVSEKVKVGLQLNNILSRKYFSYGYGGSWLNGETLDTRDSWAYFFPQAPFNALANLTVNF